jgi:hypothetical protein
MFRPKRFHFKKVWGCTGRQKSEAGGITRYAPDFVDTHKIHSSSLPPLQFLACIVFQRHVHSGDSRQNEWKADGHAKEILDEGSILRIHTRFA